jgi:hypothetical protein
VVVGFPETMGMATTSANMTLRAITTIFLTLSPFSIHVRTCRALFQLTDLFPPTITPTCCLPIKKLYKGLGTPAYAAGLPFSRGARMRLHTGISTNTR